MRSRSTSTATTRARAFGEHGRQRAAPRADLERRSRLAAISAASTMRFEDVGVGEEVLAEALLGARGRRPPLREDVDVEPLRASSQSALRPGSQGR